MPFVTVVDRIVQVGGTGLTLVLWALAIVGALSTVYGPVPGSLSIVLAGVPLLLVWMRFRSITLTQLLVRLGLSELRYGHRDD